MSWVAIGNLVCIALFGGLPVGVLLGRRLRGNRTPAEQAAEDAAQVIALAEWRQAHPPRPKLYVVQGGR